MSIFDGGRDGYYGEDGKWRRTKFCFVSCGARCTCRPIGPFYNPLYDVSKQPIEPLVQEDRDY